MKVFVLMWHYIESDGISGVFLSREAAIEHQAKAAGVDGSTTIHEMEIGKFYDDDELQDEDYFCNPRK